VKLVHDRFALQLRRAEQNWRSGGGPASGDGDGAVVRAAFEAMRGRLMELRRDMTIGDAAFQRVEEELDWSEQGWAQVTAEARDTN
jgi:monovalent cation/hydrogen antiporter